MHISLSSCCVCVLRHSSPKYHVLDTRRLCSSLMPKDLTADDIRSRPIVDECVVCWLLISWIDMQSQYFERFQVVFYSEVTVNKKKRILVKASRPGTSAELIKASMMKLLPHRYQRHNVFNAHARTCGTDSYVKYLANKLGCVSSIYYTCMDRFLAGRVVKLALEFQEIVRLRRSQSEFLGNCAFTQIVVRVRRTLYSAQIK